MPRKVWIIAGESSGDTYGAHLATAMRRLADADSLAISGMGGDAMRQAGLEIMVDSTELGVVGLIEVLKHYPLFRRIFNDLVARAARERPDVVVLIDYPGFNLRLAEQLHRLGIRVVYYVSPQVWAWGKRRVPKMAKILTRMLVIFPFEVEIYRAVNLPTAFVGHPLTHILRERRAATVVRESGTVLLLPGSRFSELDRLLEPMIATAVALWRRRPDLRFVLATPRERIRDRIMERLPGLYAEYGVGRASGIAVPPLPLEVVCGETEAWMSRATIGLAASGTVTVQAAILGLPLVVVYRVNPLTAMLGRMLVDVPYIAMPNLVAGRLVYEEFIQGDVNPEVLVPALERILPGGQRADEVRDGIHAAVAALGGEADANASEVAAREVLDVLHAP